MQCRGEKVNLNPSSLGSGQDIKLKNFIPSTSYIEKVRMRRRNFEPSFPTKDYYAVNFSFFLNQNS